MRRRARKRNDDMNYRNLMFWTGGVLLISVIVFGITYAVYSSKVKNEARVSALNTKKVGELIPSLQTTIENDTETASTVIGKTVNEMQETNDAANVQVEEEKTKLIEENIECVEEEQEEAQELPKEEQKKELKFISPVEGEILKAFAKDSLVFSETLQEWTTHIGIDIKAEKTTVVKASERGIVKSIKNDPRYGLAVTVEHDDGFKTVYANLLTAEFVSEGESVKQGQTLGTVGTTATFEASDEPHLHFEIWKDGEAINPNIYLK
ncbi:MAG: M23 family metallopeptidase [Clostridia bacterium]|nr:M23 family metallopeptidase [Clostridia bacterium]